jgi:hypothetical protein
VHSEVSSPLIVSRFESQERDTFLSADAVNLLLAHAVAFLVGKDFRERPLPVGAAFPRKAGKPSVRPGIGTDVKTI